MLAITLDKKQIDGDYNDKWELCFDQQRGKFFIRHTTHFPKVEALPLVENLMPQIFPDLIAEKLKELGFVDDGIEFKPPKNQATQILKPDQPI